MVPPGLPVITTDRTLGAGTASNCPPPLLMVMGFAFTADTVITVCGVSWKSKFTVVPDGTAKVFGVKARFLTVIVGTGPGGGAPGRGQGTPIGSAVTNSPPLITSSEPIIPSIMWVST